MAEQHTCTCDACGKDLSSVSDQPGHERLRLRSESIPWVNKSGVATSMHITPLLERDYHFCNMACLLDWAEKKPRLDALDALAAQAQELNMGY